MIIVNIQNIKLKLPNKLHELSLEKGIQIQEAIETNTLDDSLKISTLAMLMNVEVELIQLINTSDMRDLFDKIEFITKDNNLAHFYNTFKLKGVEYGIVNMSDITVREYGEIEFYLNEGETYFSHLHKIASILYRPIIQKNKNLHHILINGYNKIIHKNLKPLFYKSYEISKFKETDLSRSSLFAAHLDFGFGYLVLNAVLNFKDSLRESYSLLYKSDEQLDLELEDQFKAEKILEFGDIWGMYHILLEISKDLFERDYWLEKPVGELFKYLSYNKQKQLYYGERQ